MFQQTLESCAYHMEIAGYDPGKNAYNYLRWFFLWVKNQLILNAFVLACSLSLQLKLLLRNIQATFFWILQTWNSFFLSSFLSRANWTKRNKPYIKKKKKKKSKRRSCLVKTKKSGKMVSPRNFAQRINSLQMCPWAWEMADGLKISVQFRWDFL